MSRYHTLYSNGTTKFTTLQVSASSVNTPISARRITILSSNQPPFIAFGTSTVTASTASFVVPAHSTLDINVTTGTHIALISPGGNTYVTILDAD